MKSKNAPAVNAATINKLLEQFRPALTEALNNGYQIGAEETRRQLAATLANVPGSNGTFTALVSGAFKKRDKTVKGSIQCPYAHCKNPGIKPLHNFCRVHDEKLSKEQKKELRQIQLDKRNEERKKAAQDKKAAVG